MARDRTAAVRKERRNRDAGSLDRSQRNKLALPAAFRGDTEWTYRWVNDEGTRIHDLTKEGEWDVCTLTDPQTSQEDQVRKPVGRKDTGEPLYAYLCREPKWILDEDRAARAKNVAELEAATLHSAKPAPEDNRSEDTAYVASKPSIKRGYSP